MIDIFIAVSISLGCILLVSVIIVIPFVISEYIHNLLVFNNYTIKFSNIIAGFILLISMVIVYSVMIKLFIY